MGVVASAAVLLSMRLWPLEDPIERPHRHDDLAPGHPHLAGEPEAVSADREHSHAYVIDDEHQRWPS